MKAYVIADANQRGLRHETIWHGNAIYITGNLCGESVSSQKASNLEPWSLLLLVWTSYWINNWESCDSRLNDFHKHVSHGKCPDIFNQYHQVKTTPYGTRQEGSLDIPSYRIEYGSRSVKVVGAQPWNRLQKDLEKYKLKQCFKWKIGQIYISKYIAD